METTQKNCKKKPPPQQPQPKIMQPSTAAAAPAKSRPHLPLQILPPPPPSPHCDNKYYVIITDQNNKKKKKEKTTKCSSLSEKDVKLAALAISLNVRLRTSDMPLSMQEHALRYARSLLAPASSHPPLNPIPTPTPTPTALARSIKKEFDGRYGPVWHCVVGKSFGSFVTYSPGGFVYFSLDSLSFLLFKTEVQPIN